jgi:branched-chain amino acid transport system permease protein
VVSDLIEFAIRGLPIGCVFALLAVGLVLTYKTSGVFNLAFAAQAYASAAVFYVLRKDQEWALVPAALIAVFIVGPLIGYILDRALYRHLRTATPLAKLVTALGLLVAIPEIVKLVLGFGSKPQFNPPPLWPVKRSDQFLWPEGSSFALDAGQIITITSTIAVLVGLGILFKRSSLGLSMRASVESPRLLELQGVNSDRVSMTSWMLSSFIAGLAGVLVAPLFASLVATDLFTILVAALAATVFANLTSIPRAVIGGLALGVLAAELAGFANPQSLLATAVRPSLPFLILFLLLVGRLVVAKVRGRDVQFEKEMSDPLSGVDPPPPAPATTIRPPWLTASTRAFGAIVLLVTFLLCWFVFNGFWLGLFIGGTCVGVVMLSMVMMTGIGGTISLAQASFAAIGAFTTARLVDATGMSVLGAMFIGAFLAAAVAAVLAVPVIRLPAVYAAQATLAFALMFETMFRPQEWVSGGTTPLKVPRPLVGSIDFADDKYFLLLAAAVFALCAVGVILVRRGTTGRFLDAVQGSEVAAASVGINPARQRLIAFTLAGGIAGLGGGLLASFDGQANYESRFVFFFGLVWLTMVITSGSRTVQAAILSGLAFFIVPVVLERLFAWPGNFLDSHPDVDGLGKTLLEIPSPTWGQGVAFILFGFGAFTYAKHPEGVIEFQTSLTIKKIVARVDSRKSATHEATDATP